MCHGAGKVRFFFILKIASPIPIIHLQKNKTGDTFSPYFEIERGKEEGQPAYILLLNKSTWNERIIIVIYYIDYYSDIQINSEFTQKKS